MNLRQTMFIYNGPHKEPLRYAHFHPTTMTDVDQKVIYLHVIHIQEMTDWHFLHAFSTTSY